MLHWGALKGFILRNFRQWFSLPLRVNGVLSVGYAYPNLVMADRYNSPGSPYWGLKAWLILALGEDHPFWKTEETADTETAEKEKIITEKIPGFIIQKNNEDAQLFTAGRFSSNFEMNHATAKYGKFVYSAKAGFCVSLGTFGLEATGCDSSLVLSEGDNYWRERRHVSNIKTGPADTGFNYVSSLWLPWSDVKVNTTLVCLGSWHLRIHHIVSERVLLSAEGGFSVPRYRQPWYNKGGKNPDEAPSIPNSSQETEGALISLPQCVSRIHALEENSNRSGRIIAPAPNLNILYPYVAVPILEGKIEKGTTILITAVCRSDNEKIAESPAPIVKIEDNGSFYIENNKNSLRFTIELD